MSEASSAAASAGDFAKSNGQPAPSAGAEPQASPEAPLYSSQTTRALVLATGAACFALFWIVGSWLQIPQFRRFEASLLQQPGAARVLDLVVAALLLGACTLIGQLVAGRRWLYAGPFVAAFGLMAWSCRGGPSRYVYQHAATAGDGRSVFLLLALELTVLSLFVGGIWYFIASRGRAMAERLRLPDASGSQADRTMLLPAIGAQILMTALLVMFLTPVDAKKGVLAGVFIGSFLAASLTEYFFAKAELAAWYWVAPAITGIVGYLLNFLANAAGAPDVTGHLTGTFASLARPLPLDYASAGMFAALLGFWTGGEHPEIEAGLDVLRPGATAQVPAANVAGPDLTERGTCRPRNLVLPHRKGCQSPPKAYRSKYRRTIS